MHKTTLRRFSLLELLIVIAIIAILCGFLAVAVGKGRSTSHSTECAATLRQLSMALNYYHLENKHFPKGQLDTALAGYGISQTSCPSTGTPYEKFYVCRARLPEADRYLVSCPMHSDATLGMIGLADTSIGSRQNKVVTWNGEPLELGETVTGTLTGGTLKFADGSTVTVGLGSSVKVIASFERSDGSLYSIIRIPNGAPISTVNCNVTEGADFEVLTPAGITGVEGTSFTVVSDTLAIPTFQYRTTVSVTSGKVWVRDWLGGTQTLAPLQSGVITALPAEIPLDLF